MSSALGSEDLENVHLVRMEDVQPSRDRINRSISIRNPTNNEQVFEICVIDKTEYDNCTVGDDSDSNIGSMVSIQSAQEVAEDDADGYNEVLIVPEILDPPRVINMPITIKKIKPQIEQPRPDTWPTLEILPGGVIKNAIDWDTDITPCPSEAPNTKSGQKEMSYACAKCSQTFKYLYCLVKHVKLHENQKKDKYDPLMILNQTSALAPVSSEATECKCQHTSRKKAKLPDSKLSNVKTYRRKLPKRLKS